MAYPTVAGMRKCTLISASQLTRRFGDFTAVDSATFEIPSGSICAVLGPNGAGKSTMVKMLTGLLDPSAGGGTVCGCDIRDPKLRSIVGVLPENLALFDALTVAEHLELTGAVFGISKADTTLRTDQLLRVLRLEHGRDTFIGECSYGMKKKTALAAALLPNPRALFLDEPFEGIDPVTSEAIRVQLRAVAQRGITVLLTSHILSMVDRIADQIVMIRQGRIVWNSPVGRVAAGRGRAVFRLGGVGRNGRSGLAGITARIAPAAAVLRAVGTAHLIANCAASNRSPDRISSIWSLLIAYQQPESAEFFGLIIGALLFFPLSSDPLEKIPPDRRKLWPLGRSRLAGDPHRQPLLQPRHLDRGVHSVPYRLASGVSTGPGRPGGSRSFICLQTLGAAVQPDAIRSGSARRHGTIDAPALARDADHARSLRGSAADRATTVIYRMTGGVLDRDALPIISMVVVVALSTSAQVLIGLDGAGAQRYRLMPLAGWRILLAKDAAFLVVLLILIAPLEVPASLTAGLAALAIGHQQSSHGAGAADAMALHVGRDVAGGSFQIFAIFAIGNGVLKYGPVFVVATVAAWVISLLWFGRKVVSDMSNTPSEVYSITLRMRVKKQPGMLGRVSAAIGAVGGIIGAVDIVESTPTQTVRDITVSASSVEHEEQIAAAVRAVPDVTLINVSDRTFLLHLGRQDRDPQQASHRDPRRSLHGLHARCRARVHGDLRGPGEGLQPDHQAQLHCGGDGWDGGAGTGRHRPGGRHAGDGRQVHAVQGIRRRRRLSHLSRHQGSERNRAHRESHRARFGGHKPGRHFRAAMF